MGHVESPGRHVSRLEQTAQQLSKITGAIVEPHEYDVGYWSYIAGVSVDHTASAATLAGWRQARQERTQEREDQELADRLRPLLK